MTGRRASRPAAARGAQRAVRRRRVRAGAQPRARLEALAREGDAGRRAGAGAARTRSTSTCPPARWGSRWPRSGSASSASRRSPPARADVRRPLARRRGGDLGGDRLHAGDVAPHHGRRAGAEDAGDHPGGAAAARCSARPVNCSASLSAPFTVALTKVANAIVRLFGVEPGDTRGAAHRRGRQGDHPPVGDRRLARPGRGGDARRRLPPARAGGARGDDADPGRGHGQRRRDGRGGAAALRLLGPHAADRDRGRQPGPGARRRPQQQPRPPLHERRPRHLDRAGDPRGADLPRDEAARRPARRAPAPAQLDRAWSRTSTAAPWGSSPSRTSSRRSWGRSRTRPTRGPTSMRRLTDGDWYVRGHVSLGDLEDVGIQLPVSSDAFNSIGGYVFSRARPAAQARRHGSWPTATRSGSSRCARTGSSRCGSTRRDRRDPRRAAAPASRRAAISGSSAPPASVRERL